MKDKKSEILAILRRAGELGDAEVDVAEVALALAAMDDPDADMESCRDHLMQMVEQTRSSGEASTLDDRLRLLRRALVVNGKYRGDDQHYDDFRNFNLIKVIDSRRGMPVALGIVYLHVAKELGWPMFALDVPGNGFLVRLDATDGRAVLDPFRSGKTCGPEELARLVTPVREKGGHGEHEVDDDEDEDNDSSNPVPGKLIGVYPDAHAGTMLAEMSERDVLLRLQTGIKSRQLNARNYDGALHTVNSMVLFAPLRDQLWYEKGLLHAELGQMRSAISAFSTLRDIVGGTSKAGVADAMLEHLSRQLN